MPASKVSRNYRMRIPTEVRQKLKIDGRTAAVKYDKDVDSIKVTPTKRGKRKTWTLGTKLTVEKIEESIEMGERSIVRNIMRMI